MKVTEPGLYAMSNATYQEQRDWLSSSMLKAALPEHYKADGSQDAFDFGTLFHAVVLEPDNLDNLTDELGITALAPKAVGVKADGTPASNPTATTAWRDAVAAEAARGRRVKTQDEWDEWVERAHAMAEAVRAHEVAAELLFRREGHVEESAFAEVDGIPCRARFDKRIPGVIVDLKSTTARPGSKALARTVEDYGYDLSAAHYLEVANAAGLDASTFALVFVTKTAPHRVTVCDLDDAWLDRGRALRRKAIARLTDPTADAYEGASGFLTLTCPPWARIREDAA